MFAPAHASCDGLRSGDALMHSTLVLKEEVVCVTTGCSNSTGLFNEMDRADKRFRGRADIAEAGVVGESSNVELSSGTNGTASFFPSASVSSFPLVDSSDFVDGGDVAFTIAAAFALSVTIAPTGAIPPGVFFILPSETLNCLFCSPSVLLLLLTGFFRSSPTKLSLPLPLPLPLLPPPVRLPRRL